MEKVIVPAALAAYELDDLSFVAAIFDREYAYIREGETRLVELWHKYHTKRLSRERKIPVNPELIEEVKQNYPPPKTIDLMMAE